MQNGTKFLSNHKGEFMSLILTLDLGITLAKCVIYDESGRAVSEAQEEMKLKYPGPGMAEQPSDDFYQATCRMIKKAISSTEVNKKDIICISADCQMGGVVTIDENYEPATYFDSPLDNRASKENEFIHKNYGDLIIRKNGAFSWFAQKILYWQKKKDIYPRIKSFIPPSAFVAGKLAGLKGSEAFIDDVSLSLSGLSDMENSKWDAELIDLLGVDPSRLPAIKRPTDIIGTLTSKAADETGLHEGIPIAAGCGDISAGFTGAGIINQGQMIDISGTGCMLGAAVNDFKYDLKNKTLYCIKSPVKDIYYLLSIVPTGKTHKWFVDEFFSEKKEEKDEDIYAYLENQLKDISPGSDGLISINFLQGRYSPPDPNIKGMFIGHTWAHSKLHFLRSIMESMAYDHYLTKEIILGLIPDLDFKTITAIGSGAKSKFWMQLKSNILQVPYRSLVRSDSSSLGSAIVGGHAVGLFKDIDNTIQDFIRVKHEVFPVKDEDKKYLKYIGVYKNLFDVLKDTYAELAK
jgi:xylulokinase